MKKLTQKLLTSFPLIWNTRVYLVLPAIIILHVIFFLTGILRTYDFKKVTYYNIEPGFEVWMFAMLIGLLGVIGWMVFYFRNNALKSFYPTTTRRLFAEFICILAIVIGLISLVESSRIGSVMKFRTTFKNVDVTAEANTVNLASTFLASNLNLYYKDNVCNDRPYDYSSAQSEAAVAIDTAVAIRRPYINNDTIPDSLVADFSYLNYCGQSIYFYDDTVSLLKASQIKAVTNRWLREGKRDSVKYVIDQHQALCRKYGANYELDVDRLVDEIFSTPSFQVKHRLSDYKVYEHPKADFIESHRVIEGINTIQNINNRDFFKENDLIIIFLALGISIVIFSFRLTRTRTWFIALIGSCIWGIILGLLAAGMHSSEGAFFVIYLLLTFGFLIFTVVNIGSRSMKTMAGVTFIWFQWTLPTIFPLILFLIRSIFHVDRYSFIAEKYQDHCIATWIDTHWSLISYLDVVVVVAAIGLLIIPLARRWQALPEE